MNLREHILAAWPLCPAKEIARVEACAVRTGKRYVASGVVPPSRFLRLVDRLLPIIARREAKLRELRQELERVRGESNEKDAARMVDARPRRYRGLRDPAAQGAASRGTLPGRQSLQLSE